MISIVLNLQMLNKFSATRDRLSELAAAALIAVPAAKTRWIANKTRKYKKARTRIGSNSVQISKQESVRRRSLGAAPARSAAAPTAAAAI